MALRCVRSGPTELLVVGVAHLTAEVADPALAQGFQLLRSWHPDLVAIECLPGHLVVEYERRGGVFSDFPTGGATQARAGASTVSGLRSWDVWQARAVARDPDSSLPDRVLGWLLAREPYNALLLDWDQADLPPAAVKFLTELARAPSERGRVGARLARSLGHQELVHFDDHAGVELLEDLPASWGTTDGAHYSTILDQLGRPVPPTDFEQNALLYWRWSAGDEFRDWSERMESAGRVAADDPTGVLRARHAQWRTRNLAMAARLREASARVPGGRIVAIVGAAHARPLRSALTVDQHDLTLVEITDLSS